MRAYFNLTDVEFEALVADLFGALESCSFERFTRGRDGGIDLRHIATNGDVHLIQCKHYPSGSFATLKSAVSKEAHKLSLPSAPASTTYRLVSSHGLTPNNKAVLADLLRTRVTRDSDIYGRDDLEGALDAHPDVERLHPKLWLASSAQLAAFLSSGVHARSRALAAEIEEALPRYVQSDSFFRAKERLIGEHVCIIAGEPGIGKTTLARMLVADAVARGYEPVEIGASIDEAWEVYEPSARQIFLYDDFLGRTVLAELEKNEESRLLALMRAVGRSGNTLFVMTTREYVLQKAVQLREALARGGVTQNKFVLALPSYSRLDRAKILYNHLWHSPAVSIQAKQVLASDGRYARLIDHRNFNPRLIEFVTGFQGGHLLPGGDGEEWFEFALDALDHPAQIWRNAVEQGLGDVERALLLVASTFGGEAEISDLELSFDKWCTECGYAVRPRRFQSALQVLDDTFTKTRRTGNGHYFVSIWNPGLDDFVQSELLSERGLLDVAWKSLVSFRQLEALTELSRSRKAEDGGPASAAAVTATKELLRSGPGEWDMHRSPSGEQYAYRGPADMEARVLFLLERSPDFVKENLDWIQEVLEDFLNAWAFGRGEPASALALSTWLVDYGRDIAPTGLLEGLKAILTWRLDDVQGWDLVVELRESIHDAFDDDEWEDLAGQFHAFLEDELDYQEQDASSDYDLDRLQRFARALDVVIDQDAFDRAMKAVKGRMDQEAEAEDYAADEALERWKVEERPRQREESAAIDELFRRFDSMD
ncbi:MAG: restriction endonuclease [Thermoleophilia bacterium]